MEEVVGFVVCVPATLIATISTFRRLPEMLGMGSGDKSSVREGERVRGKEGNDVCLRVEAYACLILRYMYIHVYIARAEPSLHSATLVGFL